MVKFTVRRIIQAIPTIIGITIISFAIMVLAPGNPASQLTAQNPELTAAQRKAIRDAMGVDAPIYEQYARWLIGDQPVTVGPVGFNLASVADCRAAAENDNLTLEICENSIVHGQVRIIHDQLVNFQGDVIPITDDLLVEDSDLMSQQVRSMVVDGEIVTVPDGFVTVNDGQFIINNQRVLAINSEVVTVTGDEVTHDGENFFANGEPFAVRSRSLQAGDGGITLDREPITNEDVLYIVDGRYITANTETGTIDGEDLTIISGESNVLEITEPITTASGSDLTFDGSIVRVNGEVVDTNTDLFSLSESDDIRYDSDPLDPEASLMVVGDSLVAIDGVIVGQNQDMVVVDGQVYVGDATVVEGTVLLDGQITIWGGRRLPVFDRDGNATGETRIGSASRGVLRGDFGNSLISQRPVMEVIREKLPATVELGALSLIIGTALGIPIGVLAAVFRGSWFDQITRIGAVVVSAIPVFWLGLMLLLIFGSWLNLLPMGNRFPISITGEYSFQDRIAHLILPTFTLASFSIATFSRYMRASLLDVLHQDYIRTAQSKGIANRRVWFIHGMRNAMIPIATIIGPSITAIIGGAVLTETIYSWPGMGRFVLDAIRQQDYPVIMAVVILFSLATVLGYLLSDLLYAALDPRIRLA